MHKELKLDAGTRLAILQEVKNNFNWLNSVLFLAGVYTSTVRWDAPFWVGDDRVRWRTGIRVSQGTMDQI